MTKAKLNFTFRVTKDGTTIQRCQTHSTRRFYDRIRRINWQNKPLKVYLRVNYGKAICNRGCVCSFYNNGDYEDRHDLLQALAAFIEVA